MAKDAHDTTPPPPVMLVVLPPDLAQIIVDRLIEDDRIDGGRYGGDPREV